MTYYLYEFAAQWFFIGAGFSLGALPVLAALLYLKYRFDKKLDDSLWEG